MLEISISQFLRPFFDSKYIADIPMRELFLNTKLTHSSRLKLAEPFLLNHFFHAVFQSVHFFAESSANNYWHFRSYV